MHAFSINHVTGAVILVIYDKRDWSLKAAFTQVEKGAEDGKASNVLVFLPSAASIISSL